MQDPYVILTRGFKNVVEGSNATGYQLKIRIPYYRGTFLSLVDFLSLEVDGRGVDDSALKIEVAGRPYTLAQMMEADDIRWAFTEPATLLVRHPGGLAPGSHTIRVGVVIRKSYFPPEDPERLYDFFGLWKGDVYAPYIEPPTYFTKRMTLVQ